jgi:spore germination protein KA
MIIEKINREIGTVRLSYDTSSDPISRVISVSLEENTRLLNTLYGSPENKDLVLRSFTIPGQKAKKCLLAYIDGLIDKKVIDTAILLPLMAFGHSSPDPAQENIAHTIANEYLPSNQAQVVSTINEVVQGVNGGDTALFIDGVSEAIMLDTRGMEHRTVGPPKLEQTVRGSQAAFVEVLRVNTGLIRGILQTSDLITEIIEVGNRVPVKCAVMYMKSLANDQLVQEVRRRIKGISVDFIPNLGTLEQFIEDHPSILFPQTLSTERPDRTAANIMEGRVAIIVDGAPFANIVPINFFAFFQTVEEFALKPPAGTFVRMLRLSGTLISIILPSVYLAISYFHQEALPTDMLMAIAGARERVPFPAIVEIILMEFSFELIREASIRVPGVLGSTIGIVGAIILGQAAVTANLVSPIMVVIIAITGLASYTIPDYRLAFALRLTRFGFLLLANFFGLVGVAAGMLLSTVMLCSMKSFGVPFMTPIAPKTIAGFDVVVKGPAFRQERRPDELNTKDVYRQSHISRKWINEQPVQRKDKDEV